MNKVHQFSKETCPPCKILKGLMMKETVINPDINYEYHNLEDQVFWTDETKFIYNEAMKSGLRSLPIIAITKDNTIVYLKSEHVGKLREEGNLFNVLPKYFPEENILIK